MNIETTFTQGLQEGYAGGKPQSIDRGGFQGKTSHVKLSDEAIYHDEWFTPEYSGGGQELIKVGDVMFTRLYGGGTPDPHLLEELGITTKDVGRYLKATISKLGEKTRLFDDCPPVKDGEWMYKYVITSNDRSARLTTGLETIQYQLTPVHLHAFILCPLL